MAVNIEIKKNGISKEITIQKIVKMKKLSYGVSDSNYILDWNKFDKYTVLFDSNCIGRGIETSIEENCLYFRLSLPSTPTEIELFYNLTKDICKKLKIKEFTRDEEIVSVKDINKFIELDKNTSITALKSISSQINNGESKNFVICGALNPITLGEREIQEIDNKLENLETLLNRLQKLDVYYASPSFYKLKNEAIIGLYFIGEEIVSVVPLDPISPFNKNNGIDVYYVALPEYNKIKYEDFINNVEKIGDYDSDHIIISLDENTINDLVSKYSIDIMTGKRNNGVLYSKTYDDGNSHLSKIKNKKLNVDELNAYSHLTIYLRWCAEHNLLSDIVKNKYPNILSENDLREIICNDDIFKGKIQKCHFNKDGQSFAEYFYKFNAPSVDYYPKCVDLYAEEYFGAERYNSKEFQDEEYLFIPYSEEYYNGLAKYIDKAWEKFNNQKEQ